MKRIVPGLLIAAGWLILLYFGSSSVFYLAMVVITVLGADEYLKMAVSATIGVGSRIYLITTLILPLLMIWPPAGGPNPLAGVAASFFLLTLYFIWRYAHFEESYEQFARVVFGLMYVGVLSSHLLMLRYLPQGGSWLIVLSAITAGSDSGAYYFGCRFGKKKLCPNISPKKTVEGAIGGLVCGVVAGMIAALLFIDQVSWYFMFAAAPLLVGIGILGDLLESIIKRGTNTKDSGTLLAGHGGILDRIDSLLLAGPVLYYMLAFTGLR